MTQNKLIIGVTGITGSGTSTVSKILEAQGGHVIHADKIVHELMAAKNQAYNEIVGFFGHGILNENMEINRKVLGAIVFENKTKLQKLESILHPLVTKKTMKIINSQNNTNDFFVIDAPLLIESKMHKLCTSTWLISARQDIRLKRIIARDNITKEAALARLKNRQSDENLTKYVNVVIENNGDLNSLNLLVKQSFKAIDFRNHRRA